MMMKTRGASQTRATLEGDTVEKPYELPKGLWEWTARKPMNCGNNAVGAKAMISKAGSTRKRL